MTSPFIREAILQEQLSGKVRCNTCERHCVLISGGKGWCRTRRNRGGVIFTTTYGAVSSISTNPIEKKPFYHFHPGTFALTAGSWSCNFGCPWCQNWHISEVVPNRLEYLSPQDFVSTALEQGCEGTSISFNEPTLSLEWSLDVFRLARASHLYNTFVSNGYMTQQAINLLVDAGLDAINVDIKGDERAVREYCQGIDAEKVWAACRFIRDRGVHLEITTLVIPGVNDSAGVLQEIAARIATELGADTPWHLSAYLPAYLFKVPATTPDQLHRAHSIGLENGLNFIYIGNLPGDKFENTYCPSCGVLLIRRIQYEVTNLMLQNGHCQNCGEGIPGMW